MRARWSRNILPPVAAVLAAMVVSAGSGVASGDTRTGDLERKIARLKSVTGAFHNTDLALAGGYEKSDECVSTDDAGMGYHYVDRRLIDGTVDKDRPEALLYASATGEARKLVGVEYIKVDNDQNLGTDRDRPSLFGRPFDGPMPGHSAGTPVHYDLHVWVWRPNPDGMFAPFNPRVSCP